MRKQMDTKFEMSQVISETFQYCSQSISFSALQVNKQINCVLLIKMNMEEAKEKILIIYHSLPFSFWAVLSLLAIYMLYRWYLNGIQFQAEYNYDQNLKYKGKPLPSFPNGWYVAIHSKDLLKGEAKAIDMAGENMVAFRSTQTGQAFILEGYCKHLGAHLGVGGKVVNKKCVQCPFHGWLYDGQTGLCVDHDNKPISSTSCEYNEDLGLKGKKLEWKIKEDQEVKLRKYPVCQLNGFVYVWIHAMQEHQDKPIYPMLDISPITKNMSYRAKTLHNVKSHMQDIPENGADASHFKFVHPDVIPNVKEGVYYLWKPKWMKGDDPNVASMFEHDVKCVRDMKQRVYQELVKPYSQKNFLSIGYIDTFIRLPFLGYKFMLNITIVQLGCSTVFIFLKSPFMETVLFHYLQPKEKQFIKVYHEAWTPGWVPFWMSALVTKMDLNQVASDMYVWDTKRFARKIFFKKGDQADDYLKGWREWYSQYYEGCTERDKKKEKAALDW